jgi:predicted solute-binding protein
MALFKKALHQFLDKEGYGWVAEGGDAFCATLQAAAAKAAKSTVTSGKGTVSTNVADYAKKDLQVAFSNASVTTSVLVELIANRKTVLGTHHASHYQAQVHSQDARGY